MYLDFKMDNSKNKLIIIGGSNGAGKTTFAKYLKKNNFLDIFVNADQVAVGLGSHELSDITAGKVVLKRINGYLNSNENFSIETTLSGRKWIKLIKQAKENNYEIICYYIFLESKELAINRVKNRVLRGGHNISEDVIIRRYKRSIDNFKNLYKDLVDHYLIFNNTHTFCKIINAKNYERDIVLNNKQNKFFWSI